jgi:hypothetical protein
MYSGICGRARVSERAIESCFVVVVCWIGRKGCLPREGFEAASNAMTGNREVVDDGMRVL